MTERSGHAAVVLDVDLDRLEPAAHSQPDQLVAVARVGEEVWSGAALVGRMTSDGPMHTKRAVTISRHDQPDVMTVVVADLFEEGLNAVERGSPAAAGQVATMYSEVWLAWPRRWAAYGQRLEGGLIRNMEPFTIGPTERLRWNLAATVSRAVDNGLHDHAKSFSGVLWTVGFEAVRLGAPDLIVEMNSLARRLLTTESRTYPELAAWTTERSWRFQADLCEYAARDLDAEPTDLEDIVREGHAKNSSGALRYVCDEYIRQRQGQELADAARSLDKADWMDLSGLELDADADARPKWSELLGDDAT